VGKFRCRIPLYHRRKGLYRSLGRRKTMPVSWLVQVVVEAEEMINLVLLTALTKEKLLGLYLICTCMQKSVLRAGHMVVIMI
jgi:hypothetical protein